MLKPPLLTSKEVAMSEDDGVVTLKPESFRTYAGLICPECNSPDIRMPLYRSGDRTYWCYPCGAESATIEPDHKY